MSFLDEIQAEQATAQRPCKFRKIADLLDKEAQKDLDEALTTPAVASAAIARALWKRTGERVSETTVQVHRRGECGRCHR